MLLDVILVDLTVFFAVVLVGFSIEAYHFFLFSEGDEDVSFGLEPGREDRADDVILAAGRVAQHGGDVGHFDDRHGLIETHSGKLPEKETLGEEEVGVIAAEEVDEVMEHLLLHLVAN